MEKIWKGSQGLCKAIKLWKNNTQGQAWLKLWMTLKTTSDNQCCARLEALLCQIDKYTNMIVTNKKNLSSNNKNKLSPIANN